MANVTISDLVSGSAPLSGAELIEIEQNGQSRKVRVQSINHDVFANAPQLSIDDISEDSSNPGGIIDLSESTISFDNGTRTFSISPTGVSFSFYIKGKKYTKTTTQSIQISDVEGLHYIYFNANGNLADATTVTAEIVVDLSIVSILYWNKTEQEEIYFADERHGIIMDGLTHFYLHLTRGTVYQTGLALGNINGNEAGNLDTHAQFSVSGGVIWDEDLMFTLSDFSVGDTWSTYYRDSADGNWKVTNSSFSVITSGSGRLAYNEFDGSRWKLTEVTDRNYVLSHVYATNDPNRPMISFVGLNEYSTISDARNAALDELIELEGGSLPFVEFNPIACVVFQTSNSYGNSVNGRIIDASNTEEYIDFRGIKGGPAFKATTIHHGNLTGIDNDDHTQYILVDGSRAFTSTINGVSPTAAANLTTKEYVDGKNQMFHIRDEKSSGTNGGTFTSGSWQTRDLNTTMINEIVGASLSVNVITLPAGTYDVHGHCVGYRCGLHKTRLRNTSDSVDLIIGTSERSYTSGRSATKSYIGGRFTIASSKTIELQHRCSDTYSIEGLGIACGFGVNEVYSDIIFTKLN